MQKDKQNLSFYIGAFIILALLGLAGLLIISSHNRSDHQAKLLAQQQAAYNQTTAGDPILRYLPYSNMGYNISSYTTKALDPSDKKPALIIKIGVVLYDADYRLSSDTLQNVINQRQQNAVNYLKSKGFDPAKYNIQYYVPPH